MGLASSKKADRGRRSLTWGRLLMAGLVILNAGWMLFDGGRAFVVGDYVTPSSGDYAGQLGPWASLVAAVGLEPRSTPVKLAFVAYGAAAIAAALAFLGGFPRARRAVLVLAVLGLWYLPFGTLINALVIVVLLLSGARAWRS